MLEGAQGLRGRDISRRQTGGQTAGQHRRRGVPRTGSPGQTVNEPGLVLLPETGADFSGVPTQDPQMRAPWRARLLPPLRGAPFWKASEFWLWNSLSWWPYCPPCPQPQRPPSAALTPSPEEVPSAHTLQWGWAEKHTCAQTCLKPSTQLLPTTPSLQPQGVARSCPPRLCLPLQGGPLQICSVSEGLQYLSIAFTLGMQH